MNANRRAGFTIIETIVVLAVLAILFTLHLTRIPKPAPSDLVEAEVSRIRGTFQELRLEAMAGEGVVVLGLRAPSETWERGASVIALEAGPMPVDSIPASLWASVAPGVRLGPGAASLGPLGEATTVPADMAIWCNGTGGCDLGGGDVTTLYFNAELDSNVVVALTISRRGDTRIFRYDAAGAAWR